MIRVRVWPMTVVLWAVARLVLASEPADAPANRFPGERWEAAAPAGLGLDEVQLARARDYALTGAGAGVVVRGGRVALAWGDTRQKFDLKSTTKSFGATMLGVAVGDGKVKLTDKAVHLWPGFGVPPAGNAAWAAEVTVAHLSTQTAGFAKPGGYAPILFRPGTMWHYSDAGPNWLADLLTHLYGRDLRDVMFERVFTPVGITPVDLTWRENSYREKALDGVKRREFGSGISANVETMARLGHLYLRGGRWRDRRILPAEFVAAAGTTPAGTAHLPEFEPAGEHGDASAHYGLLWWNNADGALGPGAPRDTYWAWGLGDSLIVVVPRLDLVVARAGKSWPREKGGGHYEVLRPFIGPVCAAAGRSE